MLEVEKKALEVNLLLVGHCTDSAANALNALTKHVSPGTYGSLSSIPAFLGLSRVDFIFFVPFLHPRYPAIAYPCWDHSARTVLRNLMNNKITVVCGTLENAGDGVQRYKLATINDLKTLKQCNPNAKIRHADITHVRQNCDATQCVRPYTIWQCLFPSETQHSCTSKLLCGHMNHFGTKSLAHHQWFYEAFGLAS